MSDGDADATLPIVLTNAEVHAGDLRILGPISLTVESGAPLILIGPNGSGKTTLLRLAMGLVAATKGSISWASRSQPPESGRAIVFQRPVMLRRTCAANLRYALSAAGVSRREIEPRVAQLLGLVGLTSVADRPARRFSGGEIQRLALARALARQPKVLFLDEPTASLDPGATKAIEDIVRTIAASGVKVVMATHDLGEARRLAGEVALLHRGQLIENGRADRFFASPATEEARQFLAGELLV